jgi:hypothetical protein
MVENYKRLVLKMEINEYKNDEVDQLMTLLFQVMTIYNALKLGWKVDRINNKKYILRKKVDEMNDLDHNMEELITKLIVS